MCLVGFYQIKFDSYLLMVGPEAAEVAGVAASPVRAGRWVWRVGRLGWAWPIASA